MSIEAAREGFAVENNLLEMIDSPELVPVISAMQKAIGMNIDQTKNVIWNGLTEGQY